MTSGVVAGRSAVDVHAVTLRLDRLQARGLVSRERDRLDKRVIHVTLSDKGRELIDGIIAGLTEKESDPLTPFSERERETLEHFLTRRRSWLENSSRER